ncbi:MAG TPA: protein phosphatase 2C domain-containing protein [Bacillota bacterium]
MDTKILENPSLVCSFLMLLLFILIKIRHSLLCSRTKRAIQIGNSQIQGSRDEQEDSFATVENDHGLLAVLADGMGGYSGGKQASSIVVNTFVEEFNNCEINSTATFFENTSFLCNQKLLKLGNEVRSGSTLAAVVIAKGYLNWISIGDSAIILWRDGELANLNKKHTFQSKLEADYQSGKISKKEMLNNPKKKRLTSYLGYDGLNEIELNKKPLKILPGDKVILCSDGVYNSISEIELENILALNLRPSKIAAQIMEKISAKNDPHQDNATVVILEYKS